MKKQRRTRKPFAVGLDLYVFVFGFEKHLVKKNDEGRYRKE
jgi:hypothetical protein